MRYRTPRRAAAKRGLDRTNVAAWIIAGLLGLGAWAAFCAALADAMLSNLPLGG